MSVSLPVLCITVLCLSILGVLFFGFIRYEKPFHAVRSLRTHSAANSVGSGQHQEVLNHG